MNLRDWIKFFWRAKIIRHRTILSIIFAVLGYIVLNFVMHFSEVPSIFSAFLIFTVCRYVFGQNAEDALFTVLTVIVPALLATQVVVPVFTPRISVSDGEVLIGYIGHDANGELEYSTRGLFEIKVRPPLFPIVKTVKIPIDNVKWADYARNYLYKRQSETDKTEEPIINSAIFSKTVVTKTNESINFDILADGWAHDELKTRIEYEVSQDPLRIVGNATVAYTPFVVQLMSTPVNFTNGMDFPIRFTRDYRMTTTIYTIITKGNYSVHLCDQPQSKRCNDSWGLSCQGANISTDKGWSFTDKILYDGKSTLDLIVKGLYVNVGANAQVEKYLVLAPCDQTPSAPQ